MNVVHKRKGNLNYVIAVHYEIVPMKLTTLGDIYLTSHEDYRGQGEMGRPFPCKG